MDLAREHRGEGGEDRLLVARLAETVRTQIQGIIDNLLAARGSSAFL